MLHIASLFEKFVILFFKHYFKYIILYHFKHLYKSQPIQHLTINITTGLIKITQKAVVCFRNKEDLFFLY